MTRLKVRAHSGNPTSCTDTSSLGRDLRSLIACSAGLALASLLAGCGSTPPRETRVERSPQVAKASPVISRSRGGGYYLDDGPGDSPPADLDSIPEPIPQ